jgi:glutamate/tyrosine decarboxylase-like PLP-dependent enzyme
LIRKLTSDEHGRLDLSSLQAALVEDQKRGIRGLAVVANAGTTNTGAVDPLKDIATLCAESGLWFHVDGAYGASAVLADRGRRSLAGLEDADSIALDPHKWLFQPFECGCLLLRDAEILPTAYAIHPEYMEDTRLEEREVNFCERGVQLSRSFRALKLWVTFQAFGRKAIAAAINNAFVLADHAARRVQDMAGWEVVTAPSMAIVSFRYVPSSGDANVCNRLLAERLRNEGSAMLSTTIFAGKTVLRLCAINPRSTKEHIDSLFDTLERLAADLNVS